MKNENFNFHGSLMFFMFLPALQKILVYTGGIQRGLPGYISDRGSHRGGSHQGTEAGRCVCGCIWVVRVLVIDQGRKCIT